LLFRLLLLLLLLLLIALHSPSHCSCDHLQLLTYIWTHTASSQLYMLLLTLFRNNLCQFLCPVVVVVVVVVSCSLWWSQY
jgi:hypothetical protein